jgi:hypothetical protein
MNVSAAINAVAHQTLAAFFHSSAGLTINLSTQLPETETSAHYGNYAAPLVDAGNTGRYLTGNVTVPADTAWSATIYAVAGGNYSPLAAVPVQFTDFLTSAEQAELAAAAATAAEVVSQLAGKEITIVGVIPPASPALTLVAGDAYLAADGRAVTFSQGGNWPGNMTGWAVVLTAVISPNNPSTGNKTLAGNGTIPSPTPPGQLVSFEITEAMTAGLARGQWLYRVVASGNGTPADQATLVMGSLTIL